MNRLLSRVIVGVLIGLSIFAVKVATGHAAESVLLASANHVSGDRCANVDVGRSRTFSVVTQYAGLGSANNITVYAFPRTATGVTAEGGNGVTPAFSIKYANGPTNWTVHQWNSYGIELWRLCARLGSDTNKVGEATLHTEPIPTNPAALANPLPVSCSDCGGGGSGTTEVEGTVALADGDAQRLDLIWIGIFLVGGITFGGAIAGLLKREQSKWGGEA